MLVIGFNLCNISVPVTFAKEQLSSYNTTTFKMQFSVKR